MFYDKKTYTVNPQVFTDNEGNRQLAKVAYNVDPVEVVNKIDANEKILGELDGKLSLKNATVTITI